MDRGGDRVEKAGIGVGGEIDRDIGLRRHCADHLDVEHDLAVGPVRIAGRVVLAVVHRHGDDFRGGGDAEAREIGVQIGHPLAAAELDDRDALALPGSGREIIERGDLERGERGGARRIGVPAHIARRRAGAEMRLRHRPIVEAEHRLDAARQLVRQVDVAGPPAIRAAGVLEALQIDAERGIELGDGSREHDGAPSGVLLDHREAMVGGKFSDRGNVRAVGAELPVELVAREMPGGSIAPGERAHPVLQHSGVAAAQNHADLQAFRGIGLADRLCPRQWLTFAALEWISRHFPSPPPGAARDRERIAHPAPEEYELLHMVGDCCRVAAHPSPRSWSGRGRGLASGRRVA